MTKNKKNSDLEKEIDALCKRNMELLDIRQKKIDRIREKLGDEYPKWAREHPDLASNTNLIFSSLLVKAPNGHKRA